MAVAVNLRQAEYNILASQENQGKPGIKPEHVKVTPKTPPIVGPYELGGNEKFKYYAGTGEF